MAAYFVCVFTSSLQTVTGILTNSIFNDNTAEHGSGGAIYATFGEIACEGSLVMTH